MVQEFISYSILVNPSKESAGKIYGRAGKRSGKAPLKWTFGIKSYSISLLFVW
jgi:hypothetical protein